MCILDEAEEAEAKAEILAELEKGETEGHPIWNTAEILMHSAALTQEFDPVKRMEKSWEVFRAVFFPHSCEGGRYLAKLAWDFAAMTSIQTEDLVMARARDEHAGDLEEAARASAKIMEEFESFLARKALRTQLTASGILEDQRAAEIKHAAEAYGKRKS